VLIKETITVSEFPGGSGCAAPVKFDINPEYQERKNSQAQKNQSRFEQLTINKQDSKVQKK
jgi:hypothetical protein